MKMQKMRFDNDCTLASVSMVLRRPYRSVLKVAKENNFIPYGKYGFNIYSLLRYMGYDCSCRCYIKARGRRPIPVKSPFIVSVPSLNNIGGFHAIVVENGTVYDPSRLRQVSFEYMMRNRRNMYYDFEKEK